MRPSPALVAAYHTARYQLLALDPPAYVHIGQSQPTLWHALRDAGCQRHWTIITADNPASQRLSADQNQARALALQRWITIHGWQAIPSHSCADDGAWPESGWCVFDADLRTLRRRARRDGQAALVTAHLGRPARLNWLRR